VLYVHVVCMWRSRLLMMVMLAGTMGVCLSPCSLPGAGPMFQLGPRDMELGLGTFYILLSSAG